MPPFRDGLGVWPKKVTKMQYQKNTVIRRTFAPTLSRVCAGLVVAWVFAFTYQAASTATYGSRIDRAIAFARA